MNRILNASGAALLLITTLFFAGCANHTEVAAVLAQSNAAMLAGQLGGLPQKTDGATPANWQEANERIESFVAAHADQKETIAPLRVRQAMLLLGHGKLSLARAAFDAADPKSLHADRDQALKRQQAHLLWWFGVRLADTWQASDQKAAETALTDLKKEYSRTDASPDTRLYFGELRAWIGLAAARQTTTPQRRKERLEDAINGLASALTDADLKILHDGAEEKAESGGLTSDVRRRLMARVVLTEFKKYNTERSVGVHSSNPDLEKLINP
jgi:hypothetical protein